jgi:phosphoglucosamine mutase
VPDAGGRYIEFCKSTVTSKLDLSGLKLVVDCANGATYHVAPNVFKELGAEVIEMGVEPNGLNINQNCGSTEPRLLQAAVLKHQADLGVALDGDGDRLIMVDQRGELVDGDELLFIIARAQQRTGQGNSAIVGTQMSNLGLEQALKAHGMTLHRSKVGDRYVIEMLKETGGVVGGESSGHIICLDKTTTGDGIIAALQVLAEIKQTKSSLHELRSVINKYPQTLINVRVDEVIDLASNNEITAAVEEIEKKLGSDGRVLLRPSGTEPVIRVMVEGRDATQTTRYANDLAEIIKSNSSVSQN